MPYKYEGLPKKEAARLLAEYGFNEIVSVVKHSPLKLFLRQVRSNYILYLLLIASIISFLVGKTFTGYTVLVVILTVTVIGFIQEYKAEEAIGALRRMVMPISIVIREGRKVEVSSKEIVPGDVLVLGNGEKVPADCIILEEKELRVNESALTGESKEIAKQVCVDGCTDIDNPDESKVFMGTYIVNGRCTAKVLHTGMSTKFGKIAHLISTADKELPLQDKVNKIAKYMVVVAIVASVTTGILTLLRVGNYTQETIVEVLIFMVAIAVSAFPEGFPVVLITTLANGAKRMSEKNAIVNRMSIIETLGEVTTICTDKTGTITRGEMSVRFIFTGKKLYEVEGTGYLAHGKVLDGDTPADLKSDPALLKLIETALLCNDSEIERTGNDNEYQAVGTPTEAALLVLGAKIGMFSENLDCKREEEIPFNSERKMMSVLCSNNGSYMVYAKGAPEILIRKCSRVLKDGREVNMTQEVLDKTFKLQQEMASHSYRTLALAYKKLDSLDKDYEEDDFTFLGLVAMEDAPREEAAEAIATAKSAGVKVKMITGDSKETAIAIASKVGIEGEVLEGADIDHMSDQELLVALKKTGVFARVRPEHKLRIVGLLKDQDEIVAMTGDGVNDAPALKEAHIGIAMGKNGTDVSRSVADLTLKDDNFATIIFAISEGRTIFNNIRKFVTYQLSCNFSEIIVLLIGFILAPFLGWQYPIIVSMQILFMNLVTDNLPALTLGLNPTSNDIMAEAPRKNTEILNRTLIKVLVGNGLLMAFLGLVSYWVSFNILGYSTSEARTTAVITLILLEIVSAFTFRSFRKFTLNRSPWVNKYLVYASAGSLLLTLLIIYTGINVVFETAPVGVVSWTVSLCIAAIALLVQDIVKKRSLESAEYINETK